ncbi:DUF1128 domain-containing protein [Paenibacillus ginsengarvi]|jgi:uncharacterized protein YfkK (UPF0435 family)|uniref:DUF1128 domain-containing protein n=1 Tax=Paenibacillus ginsengarvi TaxID=400777 RepID=A0A3B0C7K7_9BACL|nr:DUF1128 domain-containing protein [Paenibacillus ginsengarvi]RKN82115.1 DUF1128 domain-containing protein [Paenibacillus ginsengarvi]
MDLTVKSENNVAFMVEGIKGKLKVVAAQSIKADHFDIEKYEDLLDMYEVVMSKQHFSISEIEALCDELRLLKK